MPNLNRLNANVQRDFDGIEIYSISRVSYHNSCVFNEQRVVMYKSVAGPMRNKT